MMETFVEKYIDDKLSDFDNLTVEDFPLFVNGKRVSDGINFKWLGFAVYDRKEEDWLLFDYEMNWNREERLV